MRIRNRITALLLSAAAVLNSGAYALAENTDCVIGFTVGNDAVVTVENAKMANAVIDTVGGRLIIRPNYEKNISVTLSDFAGVSAGSKFVKIRYAFREGFNTDGKMAAEINGRKYILDTLTDKLPGKWYDAICAAEFSGNDKIKLLPVYSDNSEWSTGGDIYIDYVGIFASYADAQNYTEKNTEDDITSVPSDNKKAAELVSSDKKFMDGYKEVQRVFKPDTVITRAEMASVISRIIKDSPETAENSPYSDVSAEDWYYADISKLYALGAIGGDTFRPTEPITRGELAEILYNLGLLDGGNTRFADVGITDKYYNILLGAGRIFSGYEDNTFRADGSLTRAEAVAAINRVLGVNIGKTEDYVQVYSDVPPTHWAFCNIMAVSDAKAAVDDEDNSGETFDGIFDVYNTRKAEWSPVPIRSKEQKDKGLMGGEGCQYLTYLAIDSTGQYIATFADVLVCTISKDGGKTYTEAGRGITAGGLSMGVFDPNNSARMIGGNMEGYSETNIVIDRGYTGTGLYLSEDYMDTFKQTFIYNNTTTLRRNDAICFDPTSYDKNINGSAVVYYSTPEHEFTGDALTISKYEIEKGYNEGPGLYRSDDGGYNWKRVNDSICHADLAVSYGGGVLYAVSNNTLYRSSDKGETFETISNDVLDIDAIKTRSDGVYVLKKKGVYFIKDSTSDLELIGNGSVDSDGVTCFRVSPVNQKNMAYGKTGTDSNKYNLMYSTDAGNTWTESKYDNSSSFFSLQPRDKIIAYSPTDENKIWTTADQVMSSDDAGVTFKWDYNGGLAACINCWWVPNVHNSDLWFVPIQDFCGAYSTDGGDTFTSAEGMVKTPYTYGGYMVDEQTMYWVESDNWEPDTGVETTLKMTFDGGKTVETKGKIDQRFLYIKCFEAPTDQNVLFAANLRSADGGKTWKKMNGISYASAYDRNDKRIFGRADDGITVMVTEDNGETWKKLFAPDRDPDKEWNGIEMCLDYDYKNNICYYGQYGKIWKWQDGKITSLWENMDKVANGIWCYALEVDPIHPEVIYASGVASRASYYNVFNNYYDILRSCDGGETWQVISTNDMEHSIVKTGPATHREARSLWVNPDTGELLATINMQGMWKFPAPYELDK